MNRPRSSQRNALALGVLLGLVVLVAWSLTAVVPVQAQRGSQPLLGGVRGVVKTSQGQLPEGMMVQLISHKTAMRTTVYSDQEGRFEFPKLEAGWHTLRIARPLEFKPYQKDSVWIEGSAPLEDIVLEKIPLVENEFLPPTPEIMAQLSDAEWLNNLPGTAQEKKTFSNVCGGGCHTWQQSLRNRFDENGWRLMMDRMSKYGQRILVTPNREGEYGGGSNPEKYAVILKFLQRVRGPNAEWPPMKAFPRPRGAATRVVITEYEFPRFDTRPHDVVGDAEGNIWYDSNREPIIGRMNPRTGAVKEFRVPITPGKHTGQHWLDVAKDGKVIFTETWSNNLGILDPRTGEVQKMPGIGGNKSLDPDGYVWGTCGQAICKYDPKTAKPVQKYPMKISQGTYGNEVSPDGRYFGGGTPWQDNFDGLVVMDIKTGEVIEAPTQTGFADPSRGGFDPDGNLWTGGRGGIISVFDRKTRQVRDYVPPTPFVTFYEAKPDKNGEVWAGAQRGGRIVRLNPKTDKWIEYQFPEPISLDWRTWVDNSTNPVTVWYGEHNGYLVRIQPLE